MQVPDLEEAVERLRDCAELEDRARECKVERHDEAEEDEDEEHAELQKLALRNGPLAVAVVPGISPTPFRISVPS